MQKKPNKPSETAWTDVEDNRNWLINLRDAALKENNFDIAVALSHTIAWLHYLMELEKYVDEMEKTNADKTK